MQEDLNVRMSKTTWSFGAREAFVLVVALLSALVAIGYQTRDAYADGTFALSTSSYNVVEGQSVNIMVSRTGATTEQVIVRLTFSAGSATPGPGPGADYVDPGYVTLTFPACGLNPLPACTTELLNRSYPFSTIDDGSSEPGPPETVNVTMSLDASSPGSASFGTISATINITDNDGDAVYTFATNASTASEASPGTFNVVVNRVGATSGTDSVVCQLSGAPGSATGGGVDYTFAPQTLTFNPGDTTKNCQVTIVDDALNDPGETIVLAFGAVTGFAGGPGTYVSHTVTITDNDGTGTVQFSQSSYTVTEGVGFASFGVTRTGGSNGAITAFCSTTVGPGTATANVDYTAVTTQQLDWGNGDASTKFCQVAITQDGTIETSEQFGLQLTGGAVGSPSTATVTINDDDGVGVLQFSSATYTGAETGGAITIDGVDVRDVTIESLRRNIGIVQQDVFLFIGTIRDNIAYGRPNASQEEIERAARAARIHDFIVSLPYGYDEWVGERGVTLSGGQKQRIAIARTLLLDPRILIFDDSTASVDTQTEFLIQQALQELMKGRTTFVIAQRLRTVIRADEIIVLDRGRVVQRGKHAELLEQEGLYRRIFDLELKDQEEALGRATPPAAATTGNGASSERPRPGPQVLTASPGQSGAGGAS